MSGDAGRPFDPDRRLDAPAFHRNHEPIWSLIAPFLRNKTGDVLEMGSGTGQHIIEFARRTPDIVWWPSDIETEHLDSIEAWRRHVRLPNVRAPLRIDISKPDWGLGQDEGPPARLLAILSANVLHISPWRVSEGLLAGAARHLAPTGRLFVYGPFMRNGTHTAPSNAAFDLSLRRQNAEWGVRDADELGRRADRFGLEMTEIAEMPANNLILLFEPKT
jgi:SAM-dependent methyltransferase